MKSIGLVGYLILAMLISFSNCQSTTTESSGQSYGGVCNGILNRCNRYAETVLCMNRQTNSSTGSDTCETGLGVDLGRCQCRRNCGDNGLYVLDGEFDESRQKCVGFVGKNCKVYPDCTVNANCNPVTRICECNPGYVNTPDGLKCVQA